MLTTVEQVTISRRGLLTSGAAAAGGAIIASPTAARADTAHLPSSAIGARPMRWRTNPFTLGVASGDPSPDGFVIWTRLAPEPLADDGLGGMPRLVVPVRWEVATDERMRRVVRRGIAIARPDSAHSVHVEVAGLRPGREYWYRFVVGPYASRVARSVTAPSPGTMPASLAMSFVSCSQYEHGLFTAYRRLAEDRPDLVLHLGDYQYEYKAQDYVAADGNVRDHEGPETVTLENYRQRHAQYKLDEDLQAAHATAPFAVVFDDHEVDNNWADDIPEHVEETAGFMARRAAAFRAYYENMPLRRASIPRGPNIQVYRRLAWGRLASFHLLDTRQFRDDQGCGDGYQTDCPAAVDPKRSITGGVQERWLLDGFRRTQARWDLIAQQVFFAQRDNNEGPLKTVSMDGWDGYVGSRDRITQGWIDAGVRNPVVLTGDVHAHWASELKRNYDDPTGPSVGTELVCSSITSGGNGADSGAQSHPWLRWNPHLKFQNNLRGYVNTTITPESLKADFRCVADVKKPGAPGFTRATFEIEDRVPTLNQTYDRPPAPSTLRGPTGQSGSDTVAWETARP